MSVRYKIVLLVFFVAIGTGTLLAVLAMGVIREERRVSAMDMNLSVMDAVASDIRYQLKLRVEDVATVIARITTGEQPPALFAGLSSPLGDELISFTQYRSAGSGAGREILFVNKALLSARRLPEELAERIAEKRPPDLSGKAAGFRLFNRSLGRVEAGGQTDVAVVSLVLGPDSHGGFLVADLLQDFLRERLQRAEQAEVFLLRRDGGILSHPVQSQTVQYAAAAFPHPVVARLQGAAFPRDLLQLKWGGVEYLVSVAESGFDGLVIVGQTRIGDVLQPLRDLLERSALGLILAMCLSTIAAIALGSRLTRGLKQIQAAAEAVAAGKFGVRIVPDSSDELGAVAESFQSMVSRLRARLSSVGAPPSASAEDAAELRATILHSGRIRSASAETMQGCLEGGRYGGAFWDSWASGGATTFVVGNAAGHDALAALGATAARAALVAMSEEARAVAPEKILERVGSTLYALSRGKSLANVTVARLEESGALSVASAGSRGAWVMRSAETSGKEPGIIDPVTEVGGLLGLRGGQTYKAGSVQLGVGDILVLCSDSVLRARDAEGCAFGDEALAEVLLRSKSRDPSALREGLETALRKHLGGTEPLTDLAFVIVRPKAAEAKRSQLAPQPPATGELWAARRAARAKESAPKVSERPNLDREEAIRDGFQFENKDWATVAGARGGRDKGRS